MSASTTPGTPTTAPSISSAESPHDSASESRSAPMASIAASASAPSSSTSWRARTSPRRSQIAPRRKRAPRSKPRTSAASGTRSKKTAPYVGPAGVRLGLLHEPGLEERLQRERDRRLRDAGAARDLGPRDGRSVADRLEHGALVQVLQQRRDCGGAWHRGSGHLVKNLTRFAGQSELNLTSRRQKFTVAFGKLTNPARNGSPRLGGTGTR